MSACVVLTFIPLQFILGHSVCTAIKVFLERVHLPAQNISERLHLCQLLSQAVTLLERRKKGKKNKIDKLWFTFPLCNQTKITGL